MRREMSGKVVLKIYCDLCVQESETNAGRLGEVTVLTYAPLMAQVKWYAQNPRGHEANRAGKWGAGILRDPQWPNWVPPERLKGYCRHHGWRWVATADVLAALDANRRKHVLTSWATT